MRLAYKITSHVKAPERLLHFKSRKLPQIRFTGSEIRGAKMWKATGYKFEITTQETTKHMLLSIAMNMQWSGEMREVCILPLVLLSWKRETKVAYQANKTKTGQYISSHTDQAPAYSF